MKIHYDYQIFCLQRYGGISRYFVELASAIGDLQKDKVVVSAPLHVNEYLKRGQPYRWKGIKLSGRLGDFVAKNGSKALHMMDARVARSTDIYHQTYYDVAARKYGNARRIVTVFDMIHERLPEYFPRNDPTPILKKRAVETADHIICISDNTKQDLLEILGPDPAKVSVVHLAPNLDDNKIAPRRRGYEYILYVGNRGGYKNFHRLLLAYAKSEKLHRNFKLLCAGGGDFSVQEREWMKDLNISPEQLEHVDASDANLVELYRYAELLVYPSEYEGFGIPPLEAMTFGCPVICSRSSSIPEVVGNAGLYFDPKDVEELKNAIETLIDDRELRYTMKARGATRAAEFSYHKCALETREIYRNLL